MAEKGKKLVGEFSVRGYDETGPWVIIGGGNCGKPDEKDIKKALKFIRKSLAEHCMPDYYELIESKMPVRDGFVNTYNINVNDIPIILKGDFVTINQRACIGCGKCVKICPLSVLSLSDRKAFPFRELDCTLCRLCEINCSERAISLHYTWIDAIKVAVRHGKRKSVRNMKSIKGIIICLEVFLYSGISLTHDIMSVKFAEVKYKRQNSFIQNS